MTENISIVYHDKDMPHIEYVDGKSDWLDLRSVERYHLLRGEYKHISLGVSIKLPDNYEAYIIPRSSLFKNYGLMQANSFGLIDNSYCGNEDIWKFTAYATMETIINKYDRICQFRIMIKQPDINFVVVDKLDGDTRGGFGSTGKK